MSGISSRIARWHAHINGVGAAPAMRGWLTGRGSLTAKLIAHSAQFRVRRLRQNRNVCLRDEAQAIALTRPQQAWEREVLLLCDGRPVVFAHTVVPLSATASDWPLFGGLGERSLGSTLFGDPLVARGALEFARIDHDHPLARRARAAVGAKIASSFGNGALFARRCLYQRHRGLLLVTEVFLPGIENLVRQSTPE